MQNGERVQIDKIYLIENQFYKLILDREKYSIP
jgi:hypothetical protein